MTKLDAGLITSLPASDPGSAAVWGSKRINPRPQFCLCLAWSGCPSNDDDDDDEVRLSMTRMRFRKGYLPGWTDELFQVAQVFRDNPPYYKIKDLQDEWLEGTFYEEELQKIYKKDDVFRIERILQRRKRKKGVEFLVKWFGYPASFNSWLPEKNMLCLL